MTPEGVLALLREVATSGSEASLLGLSEAFETVSDSDAEELLRRPETREVASAVGRAYRRWVFERELRDVRRLLDGGSALSDEPDGFAKRTYTRVADLFEGERLAGVARFVMVGCGPLPATLLHVLERTRIPRAVGIDIQPSAVQAAAALLERHAGRIDVVRAEGAGFDFSGSDFVYVANLVEDKQGILERIAATASDKVRIALRQPVGLGEVVAERGRAPAGFRLSQYGPREGRFASRHAFLERAR